MSIPNSVFISYAREDETAARNLHKRLLNDGYKPWLDVYDLIAGENWDYAIRRALKDSAFCIVCLSQNSVNKRSYLQHEYQLALDICDEMDDEDIFLLPVRLDECEIPEKFSHLQWVDMFKPEGWKSVKHALTTGSTRRSTPERELMQGSSNQEESTDDLDQSQADVNINNSSIGRLIPALPDGITGAGRLWAFTIGVGHIPCYIFLALALVLIIAGNLLIAIPNSTSLLQIVYEQYSFSAFRYLQNYNQWVVSALLALGYALLFLSILNIIYRNRLPTIERIAAISLATMITIAILNISVVFFSGNQTREFTEQTIFHKLSGWSDNLRSVQNRSAGGFRTDRAADNPTQVWTSAQILTALLNAHQNKIISNLDGDLLWKAFEYINSTRTTNDGGGWGIFDNSPRTITEIISWVVVAESMALKPENTKLFTEEKIQQLKQRISREVTILSQRQRKNGGWAPITDVSGKEARTYSTIMAVWALVVASDYLHEDQVILAQEAAQNGIEWLLRHHDDDYGWVPKPGKRPATESFPGLTAQILFVLGKTSEKPAFSFLNTRGRFIEAKLAFLESFYIPDGPLNSMDRRTPDTDQHIIEAGFTMEASTFLWYPWAVVELEALSYDDSLAGSEQKKAKYYRDLMLLHWDEMDDLVQEAFPYIVAENLYTLSETVGVRE